VAVGAWIGAMSWMTSRFGVGHVILRLRSADTWSSTEFRRDVFRCFSASWEVFPDGCSKPRSTTLSRMRGCWTECFVDFEPGGTCASALYEQSAIAFIASFLVFHMGMLEISAKVAVLRCRLRK
jgi:hypothetical protein